MAAEHTTTLIIRLPPGLLEDARAQAAARGVGVSEHVRGLIAAAAEPEPEPAPAPEPEPEPEPGPVFCPACRAPARPVRGPGGYRTGRWYCPASPMHHHFNP